MIEMDRRIKATPENPDPYAEHTETEYRPTEEDIGQVNFHYRGFSVFSDWSQAWGDEIDGCETFICRTNELREAVDPQTNKWTGTVWGVPQHSEHGMEKGYAIRPRRFISGVDEMIAEAESNLENSDLSDEAKAEVQQSWESFGWYN